jgi:tRNA(Arg) A34 adenosine deaminase TadA
VPIYPARVELSLPDWMAARLADGSGIYPTREARMQLAIDVAAENVRRGTGGPFGAAVFRVPSGELIAAGVNVVMASRCSTAHAEVMALALAQQALGTHDVAERCGDGVELATSAEPCGMCIGAILWSGVRHVVCAATREDVESLGFDEGLRTDDWQRELATRGIQVACAVLRAEAHAVLENYARAGGFIYNGAAPRNP